MIDYEIVAAFSMEIGDRNKKIMEYIPDEKDHLLKHLAASSLHLALFMRDILNDQTGKYKNINPELEKIFLDNCGCKEKE